MSSESGTASNRGSEQGMERSLGVWQATALNIANMVGIGPFITIPAFIAAMQGPHAIIAWVLAAILVLCDGMVWAELGAAMPGSGGSYHYLKQIFGRYAWGNIIPFLFIWQFVITGALEIASGYTGALYYLNYAAPGIETSLQSLGLPGGSKWISAAAALAVTMLLCQRVGRVGWLGTLLCTMTLGTVLTIIVLGISNFNPNLFQVPENAWSFDDKFRAGLGAAMLIAIYDYLGYFNVCHLGDEVRNPGKTIPRAIFLSTGLIAVLYLTMNISVMGVVPWQEAMVSKEIAATFMERLMGRQVAAGFSWLIIGTALAGLFALTLAYSRIPYAAAKAGDFFPVFAKLHATGKYPVVSLWVMGAITAACCFLDLQTLIEAAVCLRIGIQFIGQIIALHLLRTTRPDIVMPFRMKLYPLPSLIALGGWIFVFASSKTEILWFSLYVLLSGLAAYAIWSIYRSREA